jgi:hypothetical protein
MKIMNRITNKVWLILAIIVAVVLTMVILNRGAKVSNGSGSESVETPRDEPHDPPVVGTEGKLPKEVQSRASIAETGIYSLRPIPESEMPPRDAGKEAPWIAHGRGAEARILSGANGAEVWRAKPNQQVTGISFNGDNSLMLVTFAISKSSDETAAIYRTSDFSKAASLPANSDHPRAMGFSWQWIQNNMLLGKCHISRPTEELNRLTAAERESDAGVDKTELAIYNVETDELSRILLPKQLLSSKVIDLGKVRNDGYVQVWDVDADRYNWLHLEK